MLTTKVRAAGAKKPSVRPSRPARTAKGEQFGQAAGSNRALDETSRDQASVFEEMPGQMTGAGGPAIHRRNEAVAPIEQDIEDMCAQIDRNLETAFRHLARA